jgi:hypothetical protein
MQTALTTAWGGNTGSKPLPFELTTHTINHPNFQVIAAGITGLNGTDAARAPSNTTLEHLLFPGVRIITKRSGSTKDYLCGGKFTLDTLQCKAILGCMVRVDGSSFWDGRGSLSHINQSVSVEVVYLTPNEQIESQNILKYTLESPLNVTLYDVEWATVEDLEAAMRHLSSKEAHAQSSTPAAKLQFSDVKIVDKQRADYCLCNALNNVCQKIVCSEHDFNDISASEAGMG